MAALMRQLNDPVRSVQEFIGLILCPPLAFSVPIAIDIVEIFINNPCFLIILQLNVIETFKFLLERLVVDRHCNLNSIVQIFAPSNRLMK